MLKLSSTVWRDFETSGVPASGVHKPEKRDIREWGAYVESLASAAQVGGAVVFSTKAQASGVLGYPPYQMAWVVNDPTPENNGIYQKSGSSGGGFWTKRIDLPYSFYRATNIGSGTPNAIEATTDSPVANSESLIVFNVTDDNTESPVTLSLNGGAPLTIKTAGGNDPVIGGLVAGMLVAGYIEGSQFRMLSDQASAAIQSAAEEAAATAVAARDVATGAMSVFEATVFTTLAVAEAYSPAVAPDYIRLEGRAAVGDGGGALYKKVVSEPSHGGKFFITLDDSVTVVWYEIAETVLRPEQFGELGVNAASDTAIFQTAFAVALAKGAAEVDARGITGAITFDEDIFDGMPTLPIVFRTGDLTIQANFNNMNFRIPSFCTWEANGTKIESSTTITSVANGEGGIGYLVNTFVGGQGRTCSSTTSNTITVSDADGIEVGATIAVYGTQRDFNFQFTLNGAIDVSATSIAITGASTIDPALAMLRLSGTEYVFGLFSGGTLDTTYTGGGRGKLGSSATSHSNGAAVLLMQSMVRTVTAINGNVLTIDENIDVSFSNAEFRFGTVGSAIVGDITIDGKDNKGVASSASWNCLGGTLSAGFTTKGRVRLKGGLTGGYMLMGARRTSLEIESIDLCGRPADGLGASGWEFGSCSDTYIHVKRTSNGNISNAIDNKSSGMFSMGLWQPNYRFHVVHDVVLSHKVAHDVTASSEGYCGSSYADCSDALAGIFDSTPQSPAPIAATGVTIEVKGYKTFFAPTGNSLAGARNFVRLGNYLCGPQSNLTVDGATDDSRVTFRSIGAVKWHLQNTGNAFTVYNGAFNAGVVLANQSATSWSAVSDRRVKDKVETLSVLDRIEGFRAVSYTNKLTGAREIGVIAQDEVARAPEFVNRGSGSDDDEITSMSDNRVWSVSYDRYGVEALQGVKELLTIIRQQQNEIEELKKIGS